MEEQDWESMSIVWGSSFAAVRNGCILLRFKYLSTVTLLNRRKVCCFRALYGVSEQAVINDEDP